MNTKLSTKGQLIIPKEIRDSHGWKPGASFEIEDLGDSIVLRPVREFPETRLEDLIGCTGYRGAPKTLAEMEEAIAEGARAHR